MWIVLWILMFMFLVLAHEFGHFITAKRGWVKVLEFGIGIPPKVCKIRTDKSGTEYTLNLLPLGWFVRMKGEDPKDEADFNSKDSFIKASLGRKIIILLAGVTMNFLVARLLFTGIFYVGTKPFQVVPENAFKANSHSYLMPTLSFLQSKWLTSGDILSIPVKIDEVESWSIASKLHLQSGDILLSINQQKVSIINVSTILKSYIGQPITISYQRGGKVMNGNSTCGNDDCILGITFLNAGDMQIKLIKFPLGGAMLAGLQEIRAESSLTFRMLGTLGANLLSFNKARIWWSINKLTGPVGVVKLVQTLREEKHRSPLIWLIGIISLALALFNVLPIPALDGGRLLWVLIQGIGKLKPEKYFNIEWYINLVFFVLLMGLWVYIILKDLVHFRGFRIPFLG